MIGESCLSSHSLAGASLRTGTTADWSNPAAAVTMAPMKRLAPCRIVVCYPLEPRHLAQIRAAAPGCEVVDAGQAGIAKEILNADLFGGHAKVPVPWDDVVRAGRLRWIQSSAAGLDHCLVPSVIASDIQVTSASGLFANPVAEQTLALLLGLLRQIPTFFRAELRKEYERQPTDDLHGRTVGIVGFGGNGRRIAQVLRRFACGCWPRMCSLRTSQRSSRHYGLPTIWSNCSAPATS